MFLQFIFPCELVLADLQIHSYFVKIHNFSICFDVRKLFVFESKIVLKSFASTKNVTLHENQRNIFKP